MAINVKTQEVIEALDTCHGNHVMRMAKARALQIDLEQLVRRDLQEGSIIWALNHDAEAQKLAAEVDAYSMAAASIEVVARTIFGEEPKWTFDRAESRESGQIVEV